MSITIVDVAVLCLILAIGCFEAAAYQRIENFSADSSIYVVLARNLLQTGRYEFNFHPHTVYPPGFPTLLAGISLLTGSATYETFIRVMPIITAAAFMVWYFVLRRVWGRSIAGGVCLLAATTAPVFRSATQDVLSDMPYFLVSGAALLSLVRLGQNPNGWRGTCMAAGGLFVLLSLATVLTRSAGVALPAGILLWLLANAPRRVRVPAVSGALVGLLAFTAWTGWTKAQATKNHAGSYASQFTRKDPHHPEAGAASFGDLLVRAVSNVPVQSSHIAALLLHLNWVNPLWYSPFAVLALVLLLCGIVSSLRHPWMSLLSAYFLAYFGIYLLWPFDEGPRFMLPIAPLAFALIWHGVVTAGRTMQIAPSSTLQRTAALAATVFVVAWAGSGGRPAGAQGKVFLVFWAFTAAAALLLWRLRWNGGIAPWLRGAGSIGMGALLLVGISQQWAIAKNEQEPGSEILPARRFARLRPMAGVA